MTADARITDLIGTFCLFQISLPELVSRAQLAWLQVVAQKASHRPGFRNLEFTDPGDTRAWLRSLPYDDQLLFHKCLDGSHITQDCKMHCQEGGSDQ